MPLYEYECAACGHRFERIQRFADPPVDRCPSCGQGPVHKQLSAPAVHFKGTGWYVTDYANKKRDGAATSDAATSSSPASATSSGTDTDAKPAPAADSKAGEKSGQ